MTDIQIPGVPANLPGTAPLVIIGPNGVGKTQLGVLLTRTNGAERIAALRNVEISAIPMQTFQQASMEVRNALETVLNAHWRQSYELQNLLAEVLAEDRESAVAYREADVSNPGVAKDLALTNTRLRRIVRVWNRHFPGRQIKINYEPVVVRTMAGGNEVQYSIAQMSEGERTALYLIARAISCSKNVLVVDEPETFFHPVLAKNLWDDLEREASAVRFAYITHDIPFALSRRGARIAIARPDNRAELLPETSSIPSDVVTEVLGAASFSISASRLIFCEGRTGSLDLLILRAWHNCQRTAVVAVGGCNAVRECVSVFRAGEVTAGISALGYVDRDAWPDSYLEADPDVRAHFVSEIEGVFCVEGVFQALAKYNRVATPDTAYASFLIEAKALFSGVVLTREILQRAKLKVEVEQRSLLNPIRPSPDKALVKANFVNATPDGGWASYMEAAFDSEEARLASSHAGSAEAFLRDFPAKTYFKLAAKHLGFLPKKMVETLCLALELDDGQAAAEQSLAELRNSIVPVLESRLWPRSV